MFRCSMFLTSFMRIFGELCRFSSRVIGHYCEITHSHHDGVFLSLLLTMSKFNIVSCVTRFSTRSDAGWIRYHLPMVGLMYPQSITDSTIEEITKIRYPVFYTSPVNSDWGAVPAMFLHFDWIVL